MLELASHIIDRKTVPFEAAAFDPKDDETGLEQVGNLESERDLSAAQLEPTNVINLMDALRRMMAQDRGSVGLKDAGRRA